jgi:NAD(P)-dependent dehydrogenase (short-subunit alcohol dehydrogenase family)
MNIGNPLEFDGRVVLIAGAAGETRKHIADAFLAAGANVVNCGARLPEHLTKTAGRQASFTALDDSDPEQIAGVVDSVNARYGRIDVMVSITGSQPAQTGDSTDSAERSIRQGLITPLHFNQAANRLMQQQNTGGSIINVSCAPEPPTAPQPCAVAAATAGLANLCSSLAVEWAPRVRVNTIAIALTQTEHLGSNGNPEAPGREGSTSPMPEPTGQLPAIGNTCLFLASSLASYISGTHVIAAEM